MTQEPLSVVAKLLEIDLSQIMRKLAKAGAIDMDLEDSPAVFCRREPGENHVSGIVGNIGVHDVNRDRLVVNVEPGIDERSDSSVRVNSLELPAAGGTHHRVTFGLLRASEVPGDKYDFGPRLRAGFLGSYRCRDEPLRKERDQGANPRRSPHSLGGASSTRKTYDRIQHLNLTSS